MNVSVDHTNMNNLLASIFAISLYLLSTVLLMLRCRGVESLKDANKNVLFKRVNNLWHVFVDGHLRTVTPQVRTYGPGAAVMLVSQAL